MNGISTLGTHRGLPATTVICLSSQRQISAGRRQGGSETMMAAVVHPPRGGEPRLIGALVPEVLARYGLSREPTVTHEVELVA